MQLYRGIYLCLGYPSLDQSLEALAILNEHPNIDFIELGLPFSDPVADGPIISAAAQSALRQAKAHGISPRQMLNQALEVLPNSPKDVYVMTYANIVYHLQRQCQDFGQLPISGLIIPDLPLSEQGFFSLQHPIIPFATPESTAQDLQQLAQTQAPFIYFVTVRGITGGKTDFGNARLRQQYSAVRQATQQSNHPVVLGFGIQGQDEIFQLAEFANGFVIGTAAVRRQGEPVGYRQFLNSLF